MIHVMLDIETMSTETNALILSIGAVKFDTGSPLRPASIFDRFHVVVDPRDTQHYGFHISADTVLWWMAAERQIAREELLKELKEDGGAVDLFSALNGFSDWYGPESLPTWGNGASFDNVVLRETFKKANMLCPWKFWDDRCYRTMKNMYPGVTHARSGTHHNALDDATYQAEHLLKIWEAL